MQHALAPGQILRAAGSGRGCRVEQFLGGGGQGEVYRADFAGTPVALKWYLPGWATTEQRRALAGLVRRRPPSDAFLWPLELVGADGVPGFGYLMLLRDARFRSMSDLMRRRVEPTFRALATAGFELAHNFLLLHSEGLCYRDISFGNVFFDPATGAVLVCDNDNVGVDGETGLGILGTPRFMAPEVVRGDAEPSSATDLFSLAVLLFYMFVMHHPLEGAREQKVAALDLEAMHPLYGTDPVFVFDPGDTSNRPVAGEQQNALDFWQLYPAFLRDLFTRAFTDGLRDPGRRVREGEWRQAMTALRDAIVYCGSCGAENFADTSAAGAPVPVRPKCWSCGRAIALPLHLRIGRAVVMLNHDTVLHPHHVDPNRMYDFGSPVAEVARHPTDERVWGLRNVSATAWSADLADGESRMVEPGETVRLTAESTIHVGSVDAVVGRSAPKGARAGRSGSRRGVPAGGREKR